MYCTGRTHLGCGHRIFIRYPPTCTHLALRQCLMKRPPTDLQRLRETGSTLDIWLVPYKVAGGVCLPALAMRRCLQRRAPTGGNRDGWETVLWLVFRRIETVLSLETPSSHVKIAQ